MATYGSSAPSQNTINYDAILSTSLFNYRKTLTDNISKSNPFFYKIQENGMYEEEDGGVAIQINLMYGTSQANTYSGYDILDVQPTDGITAAFFDWRQAAVPVSISRLEERQNASAHRVVELMKTKIQQAEIGIKEFFGKMILQGNALTGVSGNNIYDPYVNTSNGSLGVDPITKLIALDPTSSTVQPTVGNINQSTSSWWRNITKTSALTSANKPVDFLMEADHIYNNASKGPGGPPDLILVDQGTFELWRAAYYDKYRRTADSDKNYPFENFKFNRATVMWDEFMPDIYSNSTTVTYGSALFINTKYCYVKYDKESNFVNTPFQKPVNQDAKVSHILWMGNTCISNRRKLGVWAKIPTTLTFA
jgi:hypothetical protein